MEPTPLPVSWATLSALLGGLSGILVLALILVAKRASRLSALLEDEQFQKRSLSTTYGRITEQWFPLMDAYPYNPQDFRFLGSPVDGVQFEEDRIVFVEFKANRSRLSRKQQRFKELVEAGEVYWEEYHFTDNRQ